MNLVPGSRIGVYEIVAPLGAGGMGEVYRAHDPKLRRQVAIKVLPPAFAADAERLARFEREAQAVAALSHPNILAIHDFGTDNAVTYAVMELLDGQSLRDVMAAGPMPRWKILSTATQIAKGLEAAHASGIVHRDIKPDNIFVSAANHVKILDFGLAAQRGGAAAAAAAETVTAATRDGAVMGTPGYMAPEQVRGEVSDHRADIFSLGCVIYEMLSGRRAFQGKSSIEAMHATLHTEPRDLGAIADVPPPLARVVERCLEKSAAARFQSATDVIFALEALSAAAVPPPRTRLTIAAAAVVTAIAAAVAVAWLRAGDEPGTPAASATASAPRGIAVLPFENLGGGEQAYFAAGVTEEVTLQIAKISALRVMSRAAVARFKDGVAELPAMTRELGVGAVLTGSVRHADDRVRVGVQLLAAPTGETMWSEQYDGDMTDIFAVQSNVALSVARALQATLAPDERARIQRLPTDNAEAYELYLKSRPLNVSVPQQNEEGIALLKRAIALDPRFALGHAVLARRYNFLANLVGRSALDQGLESARTAVALDPQLSRAHYALAIIQSGLGQAEESRLAMQRAIELDPNFWTAIEDFSLHETNTGRLDQGMYWAKRGIPLAPNIGYSYYHLGIPLLLLDDQIAERWLRAAAQRFPVTAANDGGLRLQILLSIIEFRRGQTAPAIERMRAASAIQPDNMEGQRILTEFSVLSGSPEAAAYVDRAMKRGPDGIMWWTPHTPRTFRAYLYLKDGDTARAEPLIAAAFDATRQAVAAGDRSVMPAYQNAALFTMRGNRDAALEALDQAERAGLKDALMIRIDPMLAPLRGEPRFAQIIQRLERDVQEMRQRVDFSDLDRLVNRSP